MAQSNSSLSPTPAAVKAITIIIAGFSGVFLLKILGLLKKKKSGKITSQESQTQISTLTAQWFTRAESALSDGWTKGVKIGVQNAKDQGAKSASAKNIPQDTLKSLTNDVQKTIKDAVSQLTEAVDSDADTDSIIKKILLRLQLSGEASVAMAVSQAVESELASPNTRKQWTTTSEVPCPHCTRLNGVIRDWGEQFPLPANYPLYNNVLFSPPLHPHCRCVLTSLPKES